MSKTNKFAPMGLHREQQWVAPTKEQTTQQWLKSKGMDAKPVLTTLPRKFREELARNKKKQNRPGANSGFMAAVNRQR